MIPTPTNVLPIAILMFQLKLKLEMIITIQRYVIHFQAGTESICINTIAGERIHISEGTHDRLNRAGGFVTSPNTTMNLQVMPSYILSDTTAYTVLLLDIAYRA